MDRETKETYTTEEIKHMLKLIPNNFPISDNDLDEIFSQEDKK